MGGREVLPELTQKQIEGANYTCKKVLGPGIKPVIVASQPFVKSPLTAIFIFLLVPN